MYYNENAIIRFDNNTILQDIKMNNVSLYIYIYIFN